MFDSNSNAIKDIADAYVCLYIFFFHVSRFTINVQYDELGQGTVIPPINSTNKRTNIFLSPMKPSLKKTLPIYFRYTSGIFPVYFWQTVVIELVIIGLNFLCPISIGQLRRVICFMNKKYF